MDTEELVTRLRQRIDETERDRGRLADAVDRLDGEIERLRARERTVTAAISTFDPTSMSERPVRDVPACAPSPVTAAEWPTVTPINAKKPKAWIRSKCAAADWYLEMLVQTTYGNIGLTLGAEMAADGAVQSLCAAVDAAIALLTAAVERSAGVPDDRRTPPEQTSWSKLAAEARFFAVELASSLSLSDALLGEHLDAPEGWLAQLKALERRTPYRNRLDVAARTNANAELAIDVPGAGTQVLIDYLTRTRDQIAELIETIFHDVADAKHGRLAGTGGSPGRIRSFGEERHVERGQIRGS